jgi:hypothetical protein
LSTIRQQLERRNREMKRYENLELNAKNANC